MNQGEKSDERRCEKPREGGRNRPAMAARSGGVSRSTCLRKRPDDAESMAMHGSHCVGTGAADSKWSR